MRKVTPLYVNEANAASLLDLKVEVFRELVRDGHLPRSRSLAPGLDRWPVEVLKAVADGSISGGSGEIDW